MGGCNVCNKPSLYSYHVDYMGAVVMHGNFTSVGLLSSSQ